MGPDLVAMFDFNADEASHVHLDQIVLAHEGRSGTFSFQQQPAGSSGVFNIGQDFQLVPLSLALPAVDNDSPPKKARVTAKAKRGSVKKNNDRIPPVRSKKTRSGHLKVKGKRQTKSTASSSKKGNTNLKRPRSTESRKRVSVAAEGEETADDHFLSTSLKGLFSWPRRMIDTIFSRIPKPDQKIHIQQFSEFSGAGTAEFAMTALAAAAPDILSSRMMHQADWDNSASRALINNAEDDSHIFGDIKDICSEEMKRKTSRRVAVEVTLYKLLSCFCCLVLIGIMNSFSVSNFTMKHEVLVI